MNFNINKSLYPYFYFSIFTFIVMLVDISIENSLVTAYISFGLMIYYIIKFYNYDPNFLLLNILIVAAYSQAAFSNIANESFNIYMYELNQIAFLNGSTVFNIFFFSILILGIKIGFLSTSKRLVFNKKLFSWLLLDKIKIIFILLVLLLILSLLIYGSPLLLGVNRLIYRQSISQFPVQLIFNLSNSLLYFMVIFYFFSNNKKPYYYLIVFYWLIQIFHGDRFSGLFFGFCVIVITLAMFIDRFPPFSKIRKYIIIAFLLFAFTIFLNISFVNDTDPVLKILSRFSMQSEIWWATQNYIAENPPNYSGFLGNVMGIGTDNSVNGINYMMKILAPSSVYDLYIQIGSQFTMGAPSLLFVILGKYLGGVAVFFSGYLFGKLTKIMVLSVNSGAIVSGYFYLKMFLIANYAITMGEYPKFTSFIFIFYFLIAVFSSGWTINKEDLKRILNPKKLNKKI